MTIWLPQGSRVSAPGWRELSLGGRGSAAGWSEVPPSGFTPDMIAGMIGWFRGDLGVTIATGASRWANQIPGDPNSDFVQATTGKQPGVSVADPAWNGQTVLTSDGTKSMQSGTWAASLAPVKTYIAIGRLTTAGAAAREFMDGSAARKIVQAAATTGNIGIFSGSLLNTTTTWANNKRVVLVEDNGASPSNIYVDDSATPKVTGSAGNSTPTILQLGYPPSDASTWLGEWAELMIYSRALTAEERAQIFLYAGARYGIVTT